MTAPIHCKSVPMKKQTHLYLGWPESEDIFRKCTFILGEIFVSAVFSMLNFSLT